MPSPVTIKIKCPVPLIEFMVGQYGPMPIVFQRKCDFTDILNWMLDIPPLDYHEHDYGPSTLTIQLPYFEDKNVLSYNYLTRVQQEMFVRRVYRFFKITFRGEMNKSIMLGWEKKESIILFQDKYGMGPDSTDMLEKDYQRYIQLRCKNRDLFRTNKNLSVKEAKCPASLASEEK